MGLNRSRYLDRGMAGTEECMSLASALARIADPELLEALVNNIGTLNEHGGELYVGARRVKARDGKIVESSEPGSWTTIGYVAAYNSKAQIPGAVAEPDVAYGTADSAPPALELEEHQNGAEPEPQEVTG